MASSSEHSTREHSYIIRGGDAGADRLEILGRVMWPGTQRLLDGIPLKPGARCLDFGCGGGDVSVKLAGRLGEKGRIVGVDMDAAALDRARARTQEIPASVRFMQVDCEAYSPAEQYDLVYARFLLSHLGDVKGVLGRLYRAVKPGGFIAVEDVNMAGHICHPFSQAFSDYVDLYVSCAEARGADPVIGPKLPAMILDAGFTDLEIDVQTPTFMRGEGKHIARITMQNIAATAIASGLIDQPRVAAILNDLEALERDPRAVLSTAQVVQVRGRRPETDTQQSEAPNGSA
ncbi:MAG: methyltransferase domain-containing protein [Pseudomonadota bacterium]